MPSKATVVKQGTFLYDGAVECDVRVVRSSVRFGTGDQLDPNDVSDDLGAPTFYVEYGSTVQRGVFAAGGGGYTLLAAAMAAAEAALGGAGAVKWNDAA